MVARAEKDASKVVHGINGDEATFRQQQQRIAAYLATTTIQQYCYCPPPSTKPSRAHPIPLAIAIILAQDRMTALQSPLAFLNAAIAAAKKTSATASLDKSRMLINIDTRALDSNVPSEVEVEVFEGLLRRRNESSLLNINFNNWKTGEFDNIPDVDDDDDGVF